MNGLKKPMGSDKMIERLRTMDFGFFKLTLKKGRLVKGFGQAFDINYSNGIPRFKSSRWRRDRSSSTSPKIVSN